MSKGISCYCKGPKDERLKNWFVIDYKCNYSRFSGGRRTPSDYSACGCKSCGARWRTNASYVEQILNNKP